MMWIAELRLDRLRDFARLERRRRVRECRDHRPLREDAEVAVVLLGASDRCCTSSPWSTKFAVRDLRADHVGLLPQRVLLRRRRRNARVLEADEDVARGEQAAGRLVVRRLGARVHLERLARPNP